MALAAVLAGSAVFGALPAAGGTTVFDDPCTGPGTCEVAFSGSSSYSATHVYAQVNFESFSIGNTGDTVYNYVELDDSSGDWIRVGYRYQLPYDTNPYEFAKKFCVGWPSPLTTTGASYFPSGAAVEIVKSGSAWNAKANGSVLTSTTCMASSGTQTRSYVLDIVNTSSTLSGTSWKMYSMSPSITGYSEYDATPYKASWITSTSARFWKAS